MQGQALKGKINPSPSSAVPDFKYQVTLRCMQYANQVTSVLLQLFNTVFLTQESSSPCLHYKLFFVYLQKSICERSNPDILTYYTLPKSKIEILNSYVHLCKSSLLNLKQKDILIFDYQLCIWHFTSIPKILLFTNTAKKKLVHSCAICVH